MTTLQPFYPPSHECDGIMDIDGDGKIVGEGRQDMKGDLTGMSPTSLTMMTALAQNCNDK